MGGFAVVIHKRTLRARDHTPPGGTAPPAVPQLGQDRPASCGLVNWLAKKEACLAAQFNRITPIFRIFDVAKAREFYLDFLGFRLDWQHSFEAGLPLFMQVSLGSVAIYLSEHHGDGSPGAKIVIATVGLADYHATIMAKSYRYAKPGMEKQPWGETTVTIADPFYNHITFSEPTADTLSA
jgi:catechol 2,3-dioxygenase-like lactoylglutathione lyase family enzyme